MSETIYPRLAEIQSPAKGNPANIHEASLYIGGEPWVKNPKCVCPIIAELLRNWSYNLPDDERNILLLPLLPLTANTLANDEIERRRTYMVLDGLIREQVPACLRSVGLTEQANTLACLPEITDTAQCWSLEPILMIAKQDISASLGAIPEIVYMEIKYIAIEHIEVLAVTVDTLCETLGFFSPDEFLEAAFAATKSAVISVAWNAVKSRISSTITRDAVRDAVRDALQPIKHDLQQSALQLVHRMIEVKVA